MTTPTLYLMVGYPGAGKTTVSKIIHDLTGAEHLWADHQRHEMYGTPTYSHEENLRLYAHLNDETAQLLKSGKSVIYDTAFNYHEDRQNMRKIAEAANAQVLTIWVHVDKATALNRATDNAHLQQTRILGNMPVETFEHISKQLEEPQANENVIELDGTKINSEYVAEKLGL